MPTFTDDLTLVDANGRITTIYLGGHGSSGSIHVQPTSTHGRGPATISLDAAAALMRVGGTGQPGKLWLFGDAMQSIPIQLDASFASASLGDTEVGGRLMLKATHGDTVQLTASDARIRAGGNQIAGILELYPSDASAGASFFVNAATSQLQAGGNGSSGSLLLFGETRNNPRVRIDGGNAMINCGGNSRPGGIVVHGENGEFRIRLSGHDGSIHGGGSGADGTLSLYASLQNDSSHPIVWLSGQTGTLSAGGTGRNGNIVLKEEGGADRVSLNCGPTRATLTLRNHEGATANLTSASLTLGGATEHGEVSLADGDETQKIRLQTFGSSGKLILQGTDRWGQVPGQMTIDADSIKFKTGTRGERLFYHANNHGDTVTVSSVRSDLINSHRIKINDDDGVPTIDLSGSSGSAILGAPGKSSGELLIMHSDGAAMMRFNGEVGNASIGGGGTGKPGRLFVNAADGGVGSTGIVLDGESGDIRIKNWKISVPDHICSPNYESESLTEVREFMDAYGHLPGIPSEAELREDGMEVYGMCSRLLGKVEELYLHAMKQENRIAALEAQLDASLPEDVGDQFARSSLSPRGKE